MTHEEKPLIYCEKTESLTGRTTTGQLNGSNEANNLTVSDPSELLTGDNDFTTIRSVGVIIMQLSETGLFSNIFSFCMMICFLCIQSVMKGKIISL